MIEVRTPEMRRQRLASMLAADGGDPGGVAWLSSGMPRGKSARPLGENHVRRPTDPCPGPCAQPEVGALHRQRPLDDDHVNIDEAAIEGN